LFGHVERAEVGTWLGQCYRDVYRHPELGITDLTDAVVDQLDSACARNWAVVQAGKGNFDILFMVDHDNQPHRDWFVSACKFLKDRPHAFLASPYSGPRMRPHQKSQGLEDHRPLVAIKDPSMPFGRRLLTKKEAAAKTGVERAYGAPTGACAMNMKLFGDGTRIPRPWFQFTYVDEWHAELENTEDFVFTQKLNDSGLGEVFVDWDHWAKHFKIEEIGKPEGESVEIHKSSTNGRLPMSDKIEYSDWNTTASAVVPIDNLLALQKTYLKSPDAKPIAPDLHPVLSIFRGSDGQLYTAADPSLSRADLIFWLKMADQAVMQTQTSNGSDMALEPKTVAVKSGVESEQAVESSADVDAELPIPLG
jgi:hypothetical protein